MERHCQNSHKFWEWSHCFVLFTFLLLFVFLFLIVYLLALVLVFGTVGRVVLVALDGVVLAHIDSENYHKNDNHYRYTTNPPDDTPISAPLVPPPLLLSPLSLDLRWGFIRGGRLVSVSWCTATLEIVR